MWYIIKKLTSGSYFCKTHLLFEKAQLIADGTEHMVLSTRNRRTLSTERTSPVVYRFTSVFTKLYESMVFLVISYGVAICATQSYNCINEIQNRVARYFLNVGRYTPNAALTGGYRLDTNRDEMLENYFNILVSNSKYEWQ